MEHSLVDMLWVVMASALVFVMQAGFAMVESGMTRSKNSINVAVKNLTDFGVSTLVFWGAGFALMFGLSAGGLIGTSQFLFEAPGAWPVVFFLFQTMFCSTAATIVSGAVAERMRFSSYIITTIVLSLLVYPIFGHWAWGGAEIGGKTGWLAQLGFVDFAGSTVVHSVGGWASLALLLIIGPRTGKYRPDGSVAVINGSNIPMAVLGVCLLWFGWFGFNGGSTLAMNQDVAGIIFRTSLGGAAGMVSALLLGWALWKKPDVNHVLNGALVGLVAITANCHAVSAQAAILIGAVGALMMIGATALLDRLRIDDAVGAIPVHLAGGIWGTLAVGLFGDPARLGTGLGWGQQIGVQALGIAVCGLWTFGLVFGSSWLLNRLRPIRVGRTEEHIGLNKAEHGVSTEIHDLFQVLDNQARTGDIALRAPVEPFTEAGQIAGMYNSVLDKLQQNTVAKDEYIQIMTNVGDGMFLLDRDATIGPYYSAALETLFASRELAGRPLVSVIASFLPDEVMKNVPEFLDVCFQELIPWRQVEKLNPLADVAAWQDDGRGGFTDRRLQFHFRRIGGSRVDRLLVLVRDHTAEVQLAEEVERTREQGQREMELLYRVLHVPTAALEEFLLGTHRDLEAVNDAFRNEDRSIKERLTEVFRLTHAIKGDAALLELDFVGDKAEQMEDQVCALLAQDEPAGEDFLNLTLLYSDLRTAVEELQAVIAHLQGFRQAMPAVATNSDMAMGFVAKSLRGLAERLALREGKEISVSLSGLSLDELPEYCRKPVKDCLVQLVRNAVRHGIELPTERLAIGKAGQGSLGLELKLERDWYTAIVRDDGAGINLERVRAQALRQGLVTAEQAVPMGERELVPLIFQAGFSTAERVDEVAGKGIGMALVRQSIKNLGGKIVIRTRQGRGSEFRLSWPAGKSDTSLKVSE